MDIERERGITIKLNTARMDVNENGEDHAIYFFSTSGPFSHVHMSCLLEDYVLNLIVPRWKC